MQPPRPTSLAHQILGQHLREGDRVIDATAGNGHDTLFLAQAIGESGHVHAFDIQEQAIASAKDRVDSANLGARVTWHTTSHELMADLLPASQFAAVVFNLGYLPGGEHHTTTRVSTTVKALHAAAICLQAGGLLSVLCYPGHPEGAEEAAIIAASWPDWADQGWRIASYSLPFTQFPSPVLWLASSPSHPNRN